MLRCWLVGLVLLSSLSAGGCRSCQNNYDYTGTMYPEGGPVYGFFDRRNSILSPDPEGAYAAQQFNAPAEVEQDAEPLLEPIPTEPSRPDPNRTTSRPRLVR